MTGDIGYVASGEVFVVGRHKDLIINAGKNVYPGDIETIINTIPGVKAGRAVVFGVSDEREGTELLAAVVEVTSENGEERQIPYARAYRVFNADQIEGLAADFYLLPDPPRDLGTVADPELQAFFAATGAQIDSTEEPRAYYNLKNDRIHMPLISTFHRAAGYYGTLAHELTHWTGHEQRCHRQLRNRFGEDAYAAEELIAELGAAFLCAHCGIDGELRHLAQPWLRNIDAMFAPRRTSPPVGSRWT